MHNALRAVETGTPRQVEAPSPASAAVSRHRNASIQYLRGGAAAAVVLYHASIYLSFEGDPRFYAVLDGRFGLYGVAAFFAISGYLMARLVRSSDPWTFLAHRVFRIFPIYLVVAALYYALAPALGTSVVIDVVALTLVPAGPRYYILGVEWTLLFETTYYVLLFIVSLASLTRRLEVLATVWIGFILVGTLLVPGWQDSISPPIYLLPFAAANVAFAGGLLLPWLLERGLIPVAGGALALAFPLTYGWFDLVTNRWIGGIAAVLLVGSAVQLARPSAGGPLGQALLKLGDWSYALYLCHVPVILSVYRLAPTGSAGPVLWSAAVALCLVTSAALGEIDVRLYGRLRRMVDGSPQRARRWLVGGYVLVFAGVAAFGAYRTARLDGETARVQRALARIGSDLATPAAAGVAIARAGAAAPDTVAGMVDGLETLPNGDVLVRGWAVDRANASEAVYAVAYCGGRQVALARPGRRRPEVAAALGADALGRERIGFTLMLRPGTCTRTDSVFILGVTQRGGATVLPRASP